MTCGRQHRWTNGRARTIRGARIRIADLLRMSSGLRFVAPQDPDYDPARGYPDHLYIYTGAIDSFAGPSRARRSGRPIRSGATATPIRWW